MATKPWYYPHDFEASYDLKIMALENEIGRVGYLFYFKTLEALGRAGGQIKISDDILKRALAQQIRASMEELESFLDVAFALDLFDAEFYQETGKLASPRFSATYDKTQAALVAARENGRLGGIKSGEVRRKKASK